MRNGKEYVESLQKMKTKVYLFGELLSDPCDHPMIKPHVNAAQLTYDLAFSPEYKELMTTTSNLTGEVVNRFTSIHHDWHLLPALRGLRRH